MNLRDLKYLIAVAELRHFGKAADACFISQPTLSTQIKKLEDELGVILIERNNKNVLLTEIGRQIVDKARQTLHSVDEMHELASQHRDPEGGKLRLGIIPTLAPYLLPYIMPALQKRFTKLQLRLHETQTATILEQLPSGELDAAILALPIHDASLKTQLLFKETFYAALPSTHALAKRKNITLNELSNSDILLLEDGHCLRDQALDLCRKIGIGATEEFLATSLETLRQMVASGNGITFMPALATKHSAHNTQRIRYIPFDKSPPHRSIVMAYRNSSQREKFFLQIGDLISSKITNILAN